MKKIYTNNYAISLLLIAFLFTRTALMSPMYCFAMSDKHPYFGISVEGIMFTVLLLVFSVLSVMVFWKINNTAGQTVSLIYLIMLSDPLFFSLQDNCLKLVIDILILLLVYCSISEKRKVSIDVFLPIVLFVSSLLVPYSVFVYAPIIISIYILVNRIDNKNNWYIKVAFIGIIFIIAGFLLNNILCDNLSIFNDFITTFTFAEKSGINKHNKLIFSFLPVVVFSGVFFKYYTKAAKSNNMKKVKKEKDFSAIIDAFCIPFIISIFTVFFLAGEGAYAINMFIPAIVIALLIKHDNYCVSAIENIIETVKQHRLIFAIVFVAVYAVALKGTINYHSSSQLVFFVRY